ncbi:MAG: hypothetical protein KW793_00405 [Candidatus Doudnabacteria bacterium]|nr:hypothetical protein [Candidatus Doudnabacteria bacterium]
MKRRVYYVIFTLLGAMLGFLLHMLIEMWYLQRLLHNFNRYSLGLSWEQLEMIHTFGVPLLVLSVAFWGYRKGVRCWQWLYVEKRYLKRWGINLKENF